MAVEDDDDLAAFFDEDMPGFASMTYQPTGGGASSTVATILDCPHDVNNIGRNGVQNESPSIQVLKSAVADPKTLDVFTVLAPHDLAGRAFKFANRILDKSGKIWTIALNP